MADEQSETQKTQVINYNYNLNEAKVQFFFLVIIANKNGMNKAAHKIKKGFCEICNLYLLLSEITLIFYKNLLASSYQNEYCINFSKTKTANIYTY